MSKSECSVISKYSHTPVDISEAGHWTFVLFEPVSIYFFTFVLHIAEIHNPNEEMNDKGTIENKEIIRTKRA